MSTAIIQQEVASAYSSSELNFRLYGALIGAQLTGDSSLREMGKSIALSYLDKELRISATDSTHFAINKVMLATALNPEALRRLSEDEPKLVFWFLTAHKCISPRRRQY